MIFYYLLTFLFTVLLLLILTPLAFKVGLVDIPNSRKIHTSPVPLGGGIAIFASFIFFIITLFGFRYSGFIYTVSGLFILGVVDDILDLNSQIKLGLQLLFCGLFVIGTENYLNLINSWDTFNIIFTIIFSKS